MVKTGRPPITIDWKEFEQLCFLQCSLREVAAWFRVTERTIERKCHEHYSETFVDIYNKKKVGGLISLRRNLFKQAENNPACAIFLAKNLLGMADKQEMEVNVRRGKSLDEYTDEELEWTAQHRQPIEARKQIEGGKG